MSTSGKMAAEGASDRIRPSNVGKIARGDNVVVQDKWLTGSSYEFEEILAGLSAAFSIVAADDLESEIARWLDQLAAEMGAEQCAVGEFKSVADASCHMQWLAGKDAARFFIPKDSWIRSRLASGQSTSISTLDELPAEALSTRQQLEEMGVRSGLWVPIMAAGSAVGGIGLSMMSHEQHWPALVIRRCQIVGDILGNAFLRRRSAREIEQRLQFEALVSDISARFLSVDAEFDAITEDVLSELGEFLGADRINYLEANTKDNSLVPIRLWFADGIEQDRSLQNVDVSAKFPWLAAKIMNNEPVKINAVEQIPDAATNERQFCEHLGIRAFTMVPATLGGEVVAALSLANFNAPQIWTDGIVRHLQIVAGIIASAEDRASRQHEIGVLRQFERALSDISSAFVNLTPENVDDQIETGLAMAAQALNVDIVTLLQPLGDDDFAVTHEWASEKWNHDVFKGVHVAQQFPWLAERLMQNDTILVAALADFPAEATVERAGAEKLGLKSIIFVPFEIAGELAGYVGVNKVTPTTWTEELVPRLRLLGEVFGQALSRRDADHKLQSSLNQIELLKEQLHQENLYLREEFDPTFNYGDILGDSESLRETLKKVAQVAATSSTVLLLGETGTGKELLARAIHNNSDRKDKLMIKVNCAALPSSLVEAELFGREKGAYTGALTKVLGRFEIADGSTILLDEIAELSLELQAKLLRVLQDGEFERLGSSKTLKVDVRVLAATNRDLTKAVENKEFRADLFYRLNVFPIVVPPLRDRAEDIPQLVWAFVQEFAEAMGKTIESIPITAMNSLTAYAWPGNVREVRNIIERAMIMNQGPILEIDLLGEMKSAGVTVSSRQLADVEREHIRGVVEMTGWRVRGSGGAAEILGLKPTTLEARMKKLGIERSKRM